MGLDFQPLKNGFAAEVRGFDLAQPLEPAQADAIQQALDKFAVLVFRDQRMNDEQQIAFSKRFGPLQGGRGGAGGIGPKVEPGSRDEIAVAGNVSASGKVMGAQDVHRMGILQARLWHTDRPFMPVPVRYSVLSTRSVPKSGGETQFADNRAAYDALPESLKTIVDPLVAEHNTFHMRAVAGYTDFSDEERAAYPPQQWPMVRINPRTGRKALYLSAHAGGIAGWSVPESRALLYHLTDFAASAQFVYTHEWKWGDTVMWDDFATMHRARPHFPETEPRDMRRTSIE